MNFVAKTRALVMMECLWMTFRICRENKHLKKRRIRIDAPKQVIVGY